MISPRTALALLVCLVLAAPVFLSNFQVVQLNYIGAAAIVALGLVLLTGVAGVMSFGQQVFAGVAAYTTSVLTVHYGTSPWIALLAGLAMVATLSLFLGAITLRLSGHYLPIATIAWGIAIYYVFGNLEVLGKHTGISEVPPIAIGSTRLDTPIKSYYLIWIVTLMLVVACANLLDSRVGRAIRALRHRAMMAESFGVNTFRLKMMVFVLAAVLAGMSGWLYAHFLGFVSPGAFNVNAGVDYLFMTILGGASNAWGAVIGAGVFTVLKDSLTGLGSITGSAGKVETVVLGAVILLLLHRTTNGLAPIIGRYLLRPARRRIPATTQRLAPREKRAFGEFLEINGVDKRFGGIHAVKGVSFSLQVGEILALVGPNGAGKSTMFNIISGVVPCDDGHVSLHGEFIERLIPSEIAQRGIARTFQHVHLISNMSVLENVAIGAHLRGNKGAFAAMLRLDRKEEAGLLGEAARQIERVGLGAHVHDKAGALPLGKQRLVEVARALCADPALLLLDEPAAGLRHAEKQELSLLLKRLRGEGIGVLLVEHDMEFLMGLADRVVVMQFGGVLTSGLPSQVQRNPAVIEAYLGSVE